MLDERRFIEWFNAVQDLNPKYLTAQDGLLAINLLRRLGQRVPDSVWQLAYPKGLPAIVRGNGGVNPCPAPDWLKLAQQCGGTVYRNRAMPDEPAVAFGNESWARFTEALSKHASGVREDGNG